MRSKIPSTIEPPYPICLTDEVITGFSRGSSELGIPTANINMSSALESLNTGIYFGFCKVSPKYEKKPGYFSSQTNQKVYFNFGQSLRSEDIEGLPMVMSIGWNPFFNNEKKAAEVHIIHHFPDTFYGASIKIAILGYLRPERDYTTKEALIEDIKTDISIAKEALSRTPYSQIHDLDGSQLLPDRNPKHE
ncbi:riboflavin kinase [Candidozyma auris]